MTLHVRPARVDELATVGDLCVLAYTAAGQLEPGSPYASTLRDAESRAADSIVLVAERGGRIVGSTTICPFGTSQAEVGGPDEVEFRFLAVLPSEWRTGVADALVAACEEHAREVGAQALAICVRDTNTEARAMYERRGFIRRPDRDWTPRPGVALLALTRPVVRDLR